MGRRNARQMLEHNREERDRVARYTAEWISHVPKLELKGYDVMHHAIEKPLAALYFAVFGRVDKNVKRKNIKSISIYRDKTKWTLVREFRLRAELLFCRPMTHSDHFQLHRKLKREKSI
jgi:hypothetical protein